MYGGHIVDDIDRRLCTSYLYYLMVDELFDDLELFPYLDPKMSHLSFKVPGQNPWEKYLEIIDIGL
jgi:dynein heavy chain